MGPQWETQRQRDGSALHWVAAEGPQRGPHVRSVSANHSQAQPLGPAPPRVPAQAIWRASEEEDEAPDIR